jgi:hypothetical protein
MKWKEFLKLRIIGLIGGLIVVISSFLPWIVSGEKILYGFWFGLLFIITLFLGIVGIVMFLLGRKNAYKISIIIGIIGIVWTAYLFLEIKSFGTKFVWITYDAQWLGEAAASFVNISYGLYIMLIGFILILLGGISGLSGNVFKLTILGLIISIVIGYPALETSGIIKQTGFKSFRCFSCEEMTKELDSAKLFLNWYNKISNNDISSENVNCLEICNSYYKNNTPSGYHEVTFDYNGKNFTIDGNGYIDSEEQAAQSVYEFGFRNYGWWFKRDNFCFTVNDCTGIKFIYGANSSWKEEGPRGTCVNKYWATYRPEGIINYIHGFIGIENWTVRGTMEYPISEIGKKPIIWGQYNCSCAKSLLSEEKVCGMGMRVS